MVPEKEMVEAQMAELYELFRHLQEGREVWWLKGYWNGSVHWAVGPGTKERRSNLAESYTQMRIRAGKA